MKSLITFVAVLFLALSCTSEPKKSDKASSENTQVAIDSTRLVTVSVPVGGMTCTGCENTIKGGVSQLPGVTDVSASFKDSVATVTFDTLLTSLHSIDSVIEAKGYSVLGQ